MVNNKGFIRIAELLIAVTLISGVLILAYRQNLPSNQTQDLSELARDILAEIATKENLRDEVITNKGNVGNMKDTLDFIGNRLPGYIRFELRVCPVSNACGQLSYVGDVFSAERVISTSNINLGPVKLRLFLWVP